MIIHSFQSNRCDAADLFLYFCYFTTSCLFAKRSNIDITLHTDSRFSELMKSMGVPYKEIIVDLDNVIEPNEFFAYAKLKALEKEPLGTIHIDGDVFLKKPGMKFVLNFNDYDCITQHMEYKMEDTQVWVNTDKGFKNVEYLPYMNKGLTHMYNCGVLGFNNEKLFETWYNGYFEFLERVKLENIQWEPLSCPDIILEQQQLTDLCEKYNYKVKTLFTLTDYSRDQIIKTNQYLNMIGYQHVVCDKYKDLDKCLYSIKNLNPVIYNNIKRLFGDEFHQLFDMAERI